MIMIRIIIIGFAMLGLLALMRLSIQEQLRFSRAPIKKWILILTGMIVISVLFGFGAPKFSPQWPDPVPYITSYSDNLARASFYSKNLPI